MEDPVKGAHISKRKQSARARAHTHTHNSKTRFIPQRVLQIFYIKLVYECYGEWAGPRPEPTHTVA
jgi:hypothetical protein